MPKGIPESGINKGWFKKGQKCSNTGRTWLKKGHKPTKGNTGRKFKPARSSTCNE